MNACRQRVSRSPSRLWAPGWRSAQDKYTVKVPDGLAFSGVQGIRELGDHRGQPQRHADRGDRSAIPR